MSFQGYTTPDKIGCEVCGREVNITKEEYYDGKGQGLTQCTCCRWFCEGEHFEQHDIT